MLWYIASFILLFVIHTTAGGDVEKLLSEFSHKLDMSGVQIIDNMYTVLNERVRRSVPEVEERNHYALGDGNLERKRRSTVVMDMVKAARKTGNREELDLRSSIPLQKIDLMRQASDIVPFEITHTSGTIHFFAVANQREGIFQSTVTILRYNTTTGEFTVNQVLNEFAAYEIEAISTERDGLVKHFLAVSGYTEDSAAGQTKVSIYILGPAPQFYAIKIQEIPRNNVRTLKHVRIQATTYLITATYYQETTYHRRSYSSPSQILVYHFDDNTNIFHFHSSLPGSGVVDIDSFTSRQKTYLIVANYRNNGGSLDIFSYVYLYSDVRRLFELTQYLNTHGARDVEHFTLANEEYIVVANEAAGKVTNKTFGVYSNVYKLEQKKFELVQSLETYGAIKWKHLSVPNCKQDVLLIYADQRDDIDQFGVFSFSHDRESFSAVPFSMYHEDVVNDTYRPHPVSLATFSTEDLSTGGYNLFLIVGSNDTSQGNNMYKLLYDIILTDSPLDAFQRGVHEQIQLLNSSLNDAKKLLQSAKDTLADAVIMNEDQEITGKKTFTFLAATTAHIDTMNMDEGSILCYMNNKTYRADPRIVPYVSLPDLEYKASIHNVTLNQILDLEPTFLYTNRPQNVTGKLSFVNITTKSITVGDDVNLLSGKVNGVNLNSLVNDIVRYDSGSTVSGKTTFSSLVGIRGDATVGGFVNGYKLSRDIVLNGTAQVITGSKIFSNDVMVAKNIQIGRVNGFLIPDDYFHFNRSSVVSGVNVFSQDLTVKNVNFTGNINNYNMQDLIDDRVTKTGQQTITGRKTISSVFSNGNVKIQGLLNGIDIDELKEEVALSANNNTIYGDKIFEGNVTILGDLNVDSGINDIFLPNRVVLRYSNQNITARKTSYGSTSMESDVSVAGLVDGINTDDIVTLQGIQNITGWKTFSSSLQVNGSVILVENSTVNEVDIDRFAATCLSLSKNQTLTDVFFWSMVEFHKPDIQGLVDGYSAHSLQTISLNSLHRSGDQTILGKKVITRNSIVRNNLDAALINGFRVPDDFVNFDDDQVIKGDKVFTDDVVFNELNGVNLLNQRQIDKFFDSVALQYGDGIISGYKTFIGNVTINRNASIVNLNGINLKEDAMFLTTEQNVTGMKTFRHAAFPLVTMMGNVGVETTIDTVDLSELDLNGMMKSRNETVTGKMCFKQTDFNRSVDYINGIDLSKLRDDIVTLNTDQLIPSDKIFTTMILRSNLNTTSTVDLIDVSELAKQTVYSNEPAYISGNRSFNHVVMLGDLTISSIDDTNFTELVQDLLFKSKNETIDALSIVGSIYVNNMVAERINELNLEADVVYKSREQKISGTKTFDYSNIENFTIDGLINGVNLTELQQEVVYLDQDQTISGKKKFLQNVIIKSNLSYGGLVNNIDLVNLPVVRTEGLPSQTINGSKVFTDTVTAIEMKTTKVHGHSFEELVKEAVFINKNEFIEGHVTFENDIEVRDSVNFENSVQMLGYINGVNLKEFDQGVLKNLGTQVISNFTVFKGMVTADSLQVDGKINGIDLNKDLMTKATPQTIKGNHNYLRLHLLGNTTVKQLTNGVNLTYVALNTLLTMTDGTQNVSGLKTFADYVRSESVSSNGLVDGIDVQPDLFMTLNTSQTIPFLKSFTETFYCEYLLVHGLVAGVDLPQLNRTRVLKSGDQTINSSVKFTHNVLADENIVITGLVNGVDLSTFNKKSPELSDDLDVLESKLNRTLSTQCNTLTYIKDSLLDSPYKLDYLEHHQTLRYHATETVYFELEKEHYLAMASSSQTSVSCTFLTVQRWNKTEMKFFEYQRIPTVDQMQVKYFSTRWNASFLLIVNYKDDCDGLMIQGSTQLFLWNSQTSKFELYASITTTKATHADVLLKDNLVYIYAVNANMSVSTWSLTPDGLTYIDSKVGLPHLVYSFTARGFDIVATAYRYAVDSSRGFIELSSESNGNLTKIQSIGCRGVSHITTFETDQKVYLIIANDRDFTSDGHSTYQVSVDVYVFSTSANFVWFQSIPAYRTVHVSTYLIGTTIYMATTHFDRTISIYQFEYQLGFQKINDIHYSGVRSANFFRIAMDDYMVVSRTSDESPDSKIWKISPLGTDPAVIQAVNDCQKS